MSKKDKSPQNGNYKLYPCALCPNMLTFRDVQEAVLWALPRPHAIWEWGFWYEDNSIPDYVYAHRACWNRVSEIRRALIRYKADQKFQPKYLSV